MKYMRATKRQIKKIHTLSDALKINNGDYRAMLFSYRKKNGERVQSSIDLSKRQASFVINSLEKVIDHTPEIKKRVYATPKQIKKIFSLWRKVSWAKDRTDRRKTLVSFLKKRFHTQQLNRLPRRKVPKVIKAITVMNNQKNASIQQG